MAQPVKWTLINLGGGNAEKIAEHCGRRWYRVYATWGLLGEGSKDLGVVQGLAAARRTLSAYWATSEPAMYTRSDGARYPVQIIELPGTEG